MSQPHVLIVEDDRSLVEVLQYNLEQSGFQVSVARDGQSGLEQARLNPPELIILDLMLPVLDGLEVCKRLRSDTVTRDVLIVLLTAKSEEIDQILGFKLGADDYVTKPFSVKILLERVRALLRRKESGGNDQDVLVIQGLMLDRRRHHFSVDNEPIELTPSEFKLLQTMMRQPGRAFTRQELIDQALGDVLVQERTIDVHIRAIRSKLCSYAPLVETVRGVGYRFREV